MTAVGMIGLGFIGSGVARCLQRAGHELVVHDLSASAVAPFVAAGAFDAASPAEVAAACDIVVSSLPGPKQVDVVARGPGGILEGIRPGGIYLDISTSSPTLTRELAEQFAAKQAFACDGPVSKGSGGDGVSVVMLGADPSVRERLEPIIRAFSADVFYAGGPGSGSVCKLVHNMIGHGCRQAIAEGMTLGVKAGVDVETLWECVRNGATGKMTALHAGLPKTVFRGEFDEPSFTVELAHKDIALATELGRELMVPLPVSNYAMQVAIEAMNRGWAAKDMFITFTLQEEAAGVQVRAPHVAPVIPK
jgi:3-hydroxyisobutyrate dehydrogenase-like beta-hydroxyacid dehydrogenase